MQKWAGLLVETGKAFEDPSAMMTQMRKDSDFWSLPPLTTLCCLKKKHKKTSEPKHTRLRFDLEKLKDPNVLKTFQAMTGGKFALPHSCFFEEYC